MSTDGGLSDIFIRHLSGHFQKVETWSTGQGVPDLNGCIDGKEFWIENKLTNAMMLNSPLSPHQIAWLERRSRNGGRVFIALRRLVSKSVRKNAVNADELFIFRGSAARIVNAEGAAVRAPSSLLHFSGGGAQNWDWDAVTKVLTQ